MNFFLGPASVFYNSCQLGIDRIVLPFTSDIAKQTKSFMYTQNFGTKTHGRGSSLRNLLFGKQEKKKEKKRKEKKTLHGLQISAREEINDQFPRI